MTRLWLQDSVAAKKPMTLSRRIEAVLYRPLPYSLPVPAFRAKVTPSLNPSPNPNPLSFDPDPHPDLDPVSSCLQARFQRVGEPLNPTLLQTLHPATTLNLTIVLTLT